MAWCHQALSHYLSQMHPDLCCHSVTRLQCVKGFIMYAWSKYEGNNNNTIISLGCPWFHAGLTNCLQLAHHFTCNPNCIPRWAKFKVHLSEDIISFSIFPADKNLRKYLIVKRASHPGGHSWDYCPGWFTPQWSPCNTLYDDVIKWKHFPRYRPFVWEIYTSPHKGQWRGALMFSLICAWIKVD